MKTMDQLFDHANLLSQNGVVECSFLIKEKEFNEWKDIVDDYMKNGISVTATGAMHMSADKLFSLAIMGVALNFTCLNY